jgi:carboxypeptidase C (cathepsin A)
MASLIEAGKLTEESLQKLTLMMMELSDLVEQGKLTEESLQKVTYMMMKLAELVEQGKLSEDDYKFVMDTFNNTVQLYKEGTITEDGFNTVIAHFDTIANNTDKELLTGEKIINNIKYIDNKNTKVKNNEINSDGYKTDMENMNNIFSGYLEGKVEESQYTALFN